MSVPGAKLFARAFARDRAADTALAGLGASAALVSVAFAGYMITVGPQRADQGGDAPAAAVPAVIHAVAAGGTPPMGDAGLDGIDFTPTGTVALTPEAPRRSRPDPVGMLGDLVVRDVFDGTALVEAQGTLHMVKPGDTLDGAGEVLAIERRGRGWTVRTAGGTIRQRR